MRSVRMRVWGLLACCLLLWAAPAGAVRDPLDEPRFTRVGDARSINDGVVTALAQDDSGLLWIGTPVGLVRHDGYQLRPVAVGGGGSGSGGTSFVRALLAAPGGVLWVGLEGEGLARLDTRHQVWTRWGPGSAQAGDLGRTSVRALALDADGVLWAGTTGGGLFSLAPGADRFQAHRAQPGAAAGGLPDDRVQSLLVDRRGDLWVGTWAGLVRRPRGGTHFEPVLSGPGERDSLAGRVVSMLGEGADGRIWVGTRQGDLLLMQPAADGGAPDVQWLDRAATSSAPGQAVVPGRSGSGRTPVLAMATASEHEVWIGRDDGIDLYDARSGRLVQRVRRDLRKPWSVAGHNVVALLRDASGQIWAGSYGGGLQRHTPSRGIWVRGTEGIGSGLLAGGDARSLRQLSSGDIWVGMGDSGVAVLDAQLRPLAEILPGRPASGGYTGGLVGALAQTADGTVWVGSEGAVHAFSPQRRWLRSHPIGQGRARRLLAARDGAVWVGTQDGVHRLAPGTATFERWTQAGGSPVSGNINALVEEVDGTVWIGGNSGLYRVRPGSRALEPVSTVPGYGLQKSVVLGLLVDRQGRLWVDTNGGLHRLLGWEGAAARFERVAESQVAGGGSVGANLLDDEQGRIWTHQIVYDPRNRSSYELGPADGVDIGTGWFRSYERLADGRLLFGGSTGLLVVQPEAFSPWSYAPPVVVSDLRIDGERVPVRAASEGLTLRPPQRSFSLEFAALDFTHADRNRYRYRLQGFDADWIETASDFRVASYGNLPPGQYRLQVQGSNRTGRWSDQQLELALTVLPAWWQTWWARAGGLLAAGLLLVAVVQARTAMLRRQQAALELRVAERTQALQALSLELQRKSDALEASSLTDPLTGLRNRRFLAQHIEADVALSVRRHEAPREPGAPPPDDADLVFFLIDIDHFKQINDEHGHAAGDAVLVQMRDRLQQAFRQADHLVRWGGEEFLIAARSTSRERAPELAERARAAVANTPFVLDNGVRLTRTCSVGFAAFPPAPGWPAALGWAAVVDMADTALFAIKRSGRDGWLGVLEAKEPTEAALRAAARQPLAEWAARGGLSLAGSPGRVQAWLAERAQRPPLPAAPPSGLRPKVADPAQALPGPGA